MAIVQAIALWLALLFGMGGAIATYNSDPFPSCPGPGCQTRG